MLISRLVLVHCPLRLNRDAPLRLAGLLVATGTRARDHLRFEALDFVLQVHDVQVHLVKSLDGHPVEGLLGRNPHTCVIVLNSGTSVDHLPRHLVFLH